MSEIDQIKQAISIVDLVGRYAELKKAGVNYAACCPFHNEKTPSFYVSPERGTFKCFGCGEGGDIFTFVEKIEGMEFKEVLHKFADETGVVLSNKPTESDRVKKSKKDDYLAILQHATLYWQKQLLVSSQALNYLKKRGFTKQMIVDYQIGYAPSGWENCKEYLLQKGISEADIEVAGIIKTGDKGGTYDRFRERIIFPLRNITGKTVAFSGRYIGSDDVSAKYLNSPETPVFNKSKELYGFDTAKHAMRKNNFAVVVEGQVDLVMTQGLFPNTIATSGTSLTSDHLASIRRFTDRLIFVFDSDSAGINAAHKASMLALGMDFEVRIATLTPGEDPADIILVDADQFKSYIKDAEDVFDFWLHRIASPVVKPREKNQLLEERVFPLLREHSNALEKDRYVNLISQRLGLTSESIHAQLKATEVAKPAYSEKVTVTEKKQSDTSPGYKAAARIALIIFWQSQIQKDARWIDVEKITNELNDEARKEVENYLEKVKKSEKSEEYLFELEKIYENSIMLQNDIDELILRVSTYKTRQHQDDLMKQHALAVGQGEHETAKQLLTQINNAIQDNASKKTNS